MNLDILYASLGVFIGELYGSFVGGGSLVTQLVLQEVVGMDIRHSIALDNAAVIGSALGLLLMLLYQGHRPKKWMYYMVIVSTLGAFFGSFLLSFLPGETVKIFFTLAVGGLVIKNMFFAKKFDDTLYTSKFSFQALRSIFSHKKEQDIFPKGTREYVFLSLAFIFITSYNAFLSIGNFAVAMLILTAVFSLRYHDALFAFAFVTIIPRAISTFEYFRYDLLEWNFYIPMLISSFVAGLGAGYIVEKIDNRYLNSFLKYLSLAMALYLVVQLF